MQILDADDVTEIFVQWYAGRSKAAVARQLGFDRKTVCGYVRVVERAGWQPGTGPVPTRAEWGALVRQWFPLVGDPRRRQTSWAEFDAHRHRIEALHGTATVAAIHRILREEHGLTASLASLRRYVRSNLAE